MPDQTDNPFFRQSVEILKELYVEYGIVPPITDAEFEWMACFWAGGFVAPKEWACGAKECAHVRCHSLAKMVASERYSKALVLSQYHSSRVTSLTEMFAPSDRVEGKMNVDFDFADPKPYEP